MMSTEPSDGTQQVPESIKRLNTERITTEFKQDATPGQESIGLNSHPTEMSEPASTKTMSNYNSLVQKFKLESQRSKQQFKETMKSSQSNQNMAQ